MPSENILERRDRLAEKCKNCVNFRKNKGDCGGWLIDDCSLYVPEEEVEG